MHNDGKVVPINRAQATPSPLARLPTCVRRRPFALNAINTFDYPLSSRFDDRPPFPAADLRRA